jgi:hypothetical protein
MNRADVVAQFIGLDKSNLIFLSLDGRFIHRRIKLKIPSFDLLRMVSSVEPPPAGVRVKDVGREPFGSRQ